MRLLTAQLTKGHNNSKSTDVYSIRIGSGTDLVTSTELISFSAGSTNPLFGLRRSVPAVFNYRTHGSLALVGSAAVASPMLVAILDDWCTDANFIITRNATIVPSLFLAVVSLSDVFSFGGRVFTALEMNSVATEAIAAGVEAGIRLGNGIIV